MGISLSGLTTIRAYKAEKNFENQFYEIQDQHSATYYLSVAAGRWIGVVLDWIANAYVAIVIVACFFMSASKL